MQEYTMRTSNKLRTFVCSVLPHSIWFQQHIELRIGGDQFFEQNTTSSKLEVCLERCITCRFSCLTGDRGSNQMAGLGQSHAAMPPIGHRRRFGKTAVSCDGVFTHDGPSAALYHYGGSFGVPAYSPESCCAF